MGSNSLFYGDNLDVLRRYVHDETVDLVYLDPPFNSNANYNVLFGHTDGSRAAAQIKAFEDTWRWDQAAAAAFQKTVQAGGDVAQALTAFQTLLGPTTMLAYLSMMAPRLVELRRVMKDSGSIYLHCDSTASHHLKLLMDAIFGAEHYRNEIIWRRYGAHNDVGQGSRHFGRVHDVILFYVKSDRSWWDQQFTPLSEDYIAKTYRGVDTDTGRRYTTKPLTAPGGAAKGNPTYEWNGHTRFWRYSKERMQELEAAGRLHYSKTGYVRQKHYLDESKGVPAQDLWADIPALVGSNDERLGYPTQKPEALMERIIESSCPPDGTVLDPFCGCGTTIAVAQRLKRSWVGIDLTSLAISLIKSRLTAMGADDYTVLGEPTTSDDAKQLAGEDPYQFQWWALGLIGARPAEGKKGADHGIDGRLFFFDEGTKAKQVIVSVKAGKVNVSHVRDLLGVLEREGAQIGVLISLNEPTGPMRGEAASAGFYEVLGHSYPRLQLLTVAELLDGKLIAMPTGGSGTQVALPPSPEELHPDQMSLG